MRKLLVCFLLSLVTTVSLAQNYTIHVVQRGETIESITKKYGVTIQDIQKANPTTKAYIYVGMKLKIPNKKVNNSQYIKRQNNTTNTTAPNEKRKESDAYKTSNYKTSPKTGSALGDLKISAYLELFGGYSNFLWNDGKSKPGIGFGASVTGQLYLEHIDIIPEGYYAELGLGYTRRGSGAYPIDYAQIKLSPLNYAYLLNGDFAIIGKLGGYAAFPLSKIKTDTNTIDTKFDYGVIVGVGAAYDKYGVMVSYERGLNNVSKSDVSLKNHCVFLTLSYKIY